MSLISAVPLASSCVSKSLISSVREHNALRRAIATLQMSRVGKSVAASTRMSSATAGSDDGVKRRIGDYHSNLWDDNFIQSLSSPYGASSYGEHAERLIGEVKEIFNSFSIADGELISPVNDFLQRLWMVDNVERLGIDRHFQSGIKVALDYVYRYWSEKGIGCGRDSAFTDLNTTALAFRIFRLHGYTVSSDVFEHFKGQKGQFTASANDPELQTRSVFNLFRASLIAFPEEKVLEEVEEFAAAYLKAALQTLPVSGLSREIQYVLDYRWHSNLPRLEARSYIDILADNTISGTCEIGVQYFPFSTTERVTMSVELEDYIGSYLKEAEWIATGYVPTFQKYFENGKLSSGHRIATLQPILTLSIPFPHHILQEIDFPSKFNDYACSILRLRGDTRCYKADSARGEEASCISCYMKENPGSTQEDALNHINCMIEDMIKKLNWEFLRPDNNAPISSKKHAFNISRGLHHFYNYRDGYSVATKETKDLVTKTVLEPVPM